MSSVPNTTTTTSPHPQTLTIAVIGGGIGGLALTLGLLKYPHIDVHVYESAPSFGEIGAGVAFGPNAQRALEIISPIAAAALQEHATGNMWASHANNFATQIVGKGPNAGQVIALQKNAAGMQSVHRAHFLEELVKGVPSTRAHFNKRLDSIDDKEDEQVVMHFRDGTSATADAVIGADGIHSHVRDHLLGKDNGMLTFSGSVAYRCLVPMDHAVEKLGAEFANNSYMICGPGKAVISYPIDHGEILNIAVMDFEAEHWDMAKWILPTEHKEVAAMFDGWSKTTADLIELLDTPDLAAWALFDTNPAPFHNKGRVAMLGDAAHATTPFQGQGAGQAVEDAVVLTALLGSRVTSPSEIPNAFTAYDQVRRPRSQRVVTTSRDAGKLLGMQAEGVGENVEKAGKLFETQMHWIWQRNQNAQIKEAEALFAESL